MDAKRKVTKSLPGKQRAPAHKKKKILIVDDDKDFLNEAREMLGERGYQVIVSDNGDSALHAAKKSKPDLILLDIVMSNMNGFQVADKLNHMPETARIPVVAITGWFIREQHDRLIKTLGIKSILIKPFKPLDMISCIERALDEARL
jgi:CheY-like chemotaxis protein